ncbi:MAG: O-antigen ligase family protein [Bacteroidales bacterium]|nr:O-antigen ligase family protein [Bacteroidales bacterium]
MIKSRSIDRLVIIVLIITVFLSEILISSGISLVGGFLILLLILNKSIKINYREISLVSPLLMILFIGLIVSLFHIKPGSKDFGYLIAKDVWYYIKPVVYLLAGLYIFRMQLKKEIIIRIMIYLSLVVALQHLIRVLIFFITAPAEDLILDTIRIRTSFVSLTEAFSLAYILLLYKQSDVKEVIYLPRWLIIAILATSLLLSFSRTLIISFIVSLLAMKNFFSLRVRTIMKSGIKILILVLAIILSLVVLNRISKNNSLLHSFTDKYLNSLRENRYLTQYPSDAVINRNWRGYEAHLTWMEIKKANLAERVFGFGFGKTVYIGKRGYVGENLENIPKFHNGFVEILLKTGFAGLLLYLVFFYFIFKLADHDNSGTESEKLFKAIIVTTFLSTFVMTGLYNKSALDSSCLLLGYFSGIFLHKGSIAEQ